MLTTTTSASRVAAMTSAAGANFSWWDANSIPAPGQLPAFPVQIGFDVIGDHDFHTVPTSRAACTARPVSADL